MITTSPREINKQVKEKKNTDGHCPFEEHRPGGGGPDHTDVSLLFVEDMKLNDQKNISV